MTKKCTKGDNVVKIYLAEPKDIIFNADGTARLKRKYGNKKRIVYAMNLKSDKQHQ